MARELAIDVRGVTKVFGHGHAAVTALRGVDFQVARGEVVILAGPSGSGKTTLLSIIGCVLKATEGHVLLFGQDVSGYRERDLPFLRRALLGFVFQGYNLLPALSARDNVSLALRLRGVDSVTADGESERLLQRVGIGAMAERRPTELSGGEMQRVAVARALAGSPSLVLADEPTASLDADNGRYVTELLRTLADEHGSTVVIVTHDTRIFDLSDRIVHIEDGRVTPREGEGPS